MRGTLGLFLVAAVAAACSSSTGHPDPDPGPVISVAGTYQTEVTIVSNDCPGQTVQQHPTVVTHIPAGSTALSLRHAGSLYPGTLTADGAFSTPPVMQVFDGISYAISITGQFTETAIDALVLVEAGAPAAVRLHRPLGRAQDRRSQRHSVVREPDATLPGRRHRIAPRVADAQAVLWSPPPGP